MQEGKYENKHVNNTTVERQKMTSKESSPVRDLDQYFSH